MKKALILFYCILIGLLIPSLALGAQVYNVTCNSTTTDTIASDTGTFARNSATGTYIDSNGVIQTASANAPRYEFVTDDDAWLLFEPAGKNELDYSEDFSQWTASAGETATANVTGPNNTANSAYTLADDSSDANGVFYKDFTIDANVRHSFSVFVKQGTSTSFSLLMNDTDAPDVEAQIDFDFDGSGVPSVAHSDQGFGYVYQKPDLINGFYRVRATSKAALTIGNNLRVSLCMTEYGVDPGAQNTIFFGAQLEELIVATSYIKTTGSPATRAADSLSYTASTDVINALQADGGGGINGGSFFCQFRPGATEANWNALNAAVGIFGSRNAAASVLYIATSGKLRSADGTQSVELDPNLARETVYNIAITWANDNTWNVYANGQLDGDADSFDATGYDTTGNTLYIGHTINLPFHIRNIKMWNTTATEAAATYAGRNGAHSNVVVDCTDSPCVYGIKVTGASNSFAHITVKNAMFGFYTSSSSTQLYNSLFDYGGVHTATGITTSADSIYSMNGAEQGAGTLTATFSDWDRPDPRFDPVYRPRDRTFRRLVERMTVVTTDASSNVRSEYTAPGAMRGKQALGQDDFRFGFHW